MREKLIDRFDKTTPITYTKYSLINRNYRNEKKTPPWILNNRINERFQERFHTEWQGTHLFKINQNGVNDVILCTNDYLCLCDEESLNVGNHENRMGEKIMSSVFLNETSYQAEVERAFSEFFGSEDSIMCQSGYAANTGLIQAIANENVPIYIDILAHMSLHDGVRLANAKSYAFAHNSVEGARKNSVLRPRSDRCRFSV